MNTQQRKEHNDLAKALISKGKLIEAGFESLRIAVIPKDAPPVQSAEMRMAFMAGAQHLFGSIMSVFDSEPTAEDLLIMDKISEELRLYAEQLPLRVATTGRPQ